MPLKAQYWCSNTVLGVGAKTREIARSRRYARSRKHVLTQTAGFDIFLLPSSLLTQQYHGLYIGSNRFGYEAPIG